MGIREVSLEKEEGGRGLEEDEPAGRDGGIESPGSQTPAAGTRGYRGIWQLQGWEPASVPWGLRSRGVGRLGDPAQPYLSRRSSGGQPGGGGCGVPNLSGPPIPRPTLGGGVGRPGPAGPVWPGARVAWGACHLEKAGSSGAGTAVGGRMPRCLQTHKYRRRTGGQRRACGQLAPPRVSWGPGGRPPLQLPASGLTVLARLCPGRSWGSWRANGSRPEGAGEKGVGMQVQRRGRDWGHRGRMGCWGEGREAGAASGRVEFRGDLGLEWGVGVTNTKMEGWRTK